MLPDPPSSSGLLHAEITKEIIGVFYEVYTGLGFGFLESIYARGVELRLKRRGLQVDREVAMKVVLDDDELGLFRCDMVIERKVIIEIKGSERLSDVSRRQLRNYLKAMNLELGMLLHFGPKASFYRILGPQGELSGAAEDQAQSG